MKTVLVDDHALFRDGVSSLLLAWGREVAGRSNAGEQEVELVQAGSPEEVLIDMRRPDSAAPRAAGQGVPPAEVAIVVLTVSAEEADLFRAIKAGAQGHMPPALEAPRLRSILEDAARGQSHASPRARHPAAAGHPVAPGGDDLQRLTERELEVLSLVTEGLRNRQIAAAMGISENTVKFHLKNVAEKLHASNRAELAARAVRSGLVPEAERRPSA
jgi:DNA-binding NarL/FixJ family response regulator